MRLIVSLFVSLLFFTPLSSEPTARPVSPVDSTGTITGTVVDANGGVPLAGANVSIDSLQIGDATGPQGRFRLTNVPAGTHEVSVAFVGYSDAQKTVSVEAGTTARVSFALSPTPQQTEELMIEQAPGVQRQAPAARSGADLHGCRERMGIPRGRGRVVVLEVV
ncbi:MAG: hypothetical protein BRD33_03640 [Bacteroidetes bacterium QH_6_63_17]|nr:MAG: hypothetical protein BRD33_03640 [Bacteroidetes bacterium QH_6_63_17]